MKSTPTRATGIIQVKENRLFIESIPFCGGAESFDRTTQFDGQFSQKHAKRFGFECKR